MLFIFYANFYLDFWKDLDEIWILSNFPTLSKFYPDSILILSRFVGTHFIQILPRFYPDFLDKIWIKKNEDKIWIKGHGRAFTACQPQSPSANSVVLIFWINNRQSEKFGNKLMNSAWRVRSTFVLIWCHSQTF